MKKLFLFAFCILSSYAAISAQQNATNPLKEYTELPDPKPIDKEAWSSIAKSSSLFCSWGSIDQRYAKHEIPNIKQANTWKGKAWKGERINLQAVIWTAKSQNNISFSFSDLKSSNGNTIPASAIESGFVRYVYADGLDLNGLGGCGNGYGKDSSLVADVIDPYAKEINLDTFSAQPIWATIWVPEQTKPGNYKGNLTIYNSGKKAKKIDIELTVVNRTLPAPKNWTSHIDWWQNPYSVARYYQVPVWSKAHFDAMRPMMTRMANAGQKVITTTISHKPWNGQTYDYFETMVTRIKKLDGSWEYCYDVFDAWVEFMMSVGIDEQINCFSMIPWQHSYQYFDLASNKLTYIKAEPGTPEYEDYWGTFLKSLSKHLREKGWFEKTTIAMDERPLKDMQIAIGIIKKSDPDFKISLAGNYHSEIEPDIYDYCLGFGSQFPEDIKAKRDKQGKKSTFYTCCTEALPNTFTFSPPAEAAWLSWHIGAGNYNGYLRWATNSWNKDPLRDTRFTTWASGDCFLIYPMNRSSIRFERFVEGAQDYEKIVLLQKELQEKGETAKLEKLNQIIANFKLEQLIEKSAGQMINEAREYLNSL